LAKIDHGTVLTVSASFEAGTLTLNGLAQFLTHAFDRGAPDDAIVNLNHYHLAVSFDLPPK